MTSERGPTGDRANLGLDLVTARDQVSDLF
jgi:hypothetical protein